MSKNRKAYIIAGLFIFFALTNVIFLDRLDFLTSPRGREFIFYDIQTSTFNRPQAYILKDTLINLSAWVFLTPWPAYQAVSECDELGCLIVPLISFPFLVGLFFIYYFFVKKIILDKKNLKYFLLVWILYAGWGVSILYPPYHEISRDRKIINPVLADLHEEGIDLSLGRLDHYFIMKQIGDIPPTPPETYQRDTNPLAHTYLGNSVKLILRIYTPYDKFQELEVASVDNNYNLENVINEKCQSIVYGINNYTYSEVKIINSNIIACYRYNIDTNGKKYGWVYLYKYLNKEENIIGIYIIGDGRFDIDEYQKNPQIPSIFND